MNVTASAYMSSTHAIKKAGTTACVFQRRSVEDFDTLSTFQAGHALDTFENSGAAAFHCRCGRKASSPYPEHSGRASQTRSASSSRQVFCTRGSMTRQCLPQSMVPQGLRRSVYYFPKAQLMYHHCNCLDPAHIILCLPGFRSISCFPLVILQEGREFLDRLQRMDNFESQDFDNVASSLPKYFLAVTLMPAMMTLQSSLFATSRSQQCASNFSAAQSRAAQPRQHTAQRTSMPTIMLSLQDNDVERAFNLNRDHLDYLVEESWRWALACEP